MNLGIVHSWIFGGKLITSFKNSWDKIFVFSLCFPVGKDICCMWGFSYPCIYFVCTIGMLNKTCYTRSKKDERETFWLYILFLFFLFFFFFGCTCGIWKFPGRPGMEPILPWQPKRLQWQRRILHLLHYKGTLRNLYFQWDCLEEIVHWSTRKVSHQMFILKNLKTHTHTSSPKPHNPGQKGKTNQTQNPHTK